MGHMTDRIQESGIDFFFEKSPIVHRRTLETLAVLTVPSALSPDDEKYSCTVIGPHLDCSQAWRRWLRVRHCPFYVELLVDPLVQGVEDRIFSWEEVEVVSPEGKLMYEPTST